jgi:tetratricopeptide (TPR) repeat protein
MLLSRVKPQAPEKQAMQLLNTARQFARVKQYVAALSVLHRAIILCPSCTLYDYQGSLLCLLNREQAALESFALALPLANSPIEQSGIYFHRALLYGREKMFDEALSDLERAQKLCPSNATYRKARACVEGEKERVCHQEVVVPVFCIST